MTRTAIAVLVGLISTLVAFLLFLLCHLLDMLGMDWRIPLGIGLGVAIAVWVLDWATEGE